MIGKLIATLIGTALCTVPSPLLAARPEAGNLYTLSNAAAGNQVIVFRRSADGSLSPAGTVASGGLGTGASLGSQGALVLSGDRNWLFAVNAGSNSISSFSVEDHGLTLVDTVASGGSTPVSLAVRGHLLYVLNQGGTGNLTGFWVGAGGNLTPIPGSTRPLSSPAAGAAQVAFSPDQESLVVSEKATNTLDVYALLDQGRLSGPTPFPSQAAVPYGFAFTGRSTLLVTDAGANAVSSYDLDRHQLTPVGPAVASEGAAPCWMTALPDGRFAYAANAHIGTIAGFRVDRAGAIRFLGLTQTPGIPVLDLAATCDFVFALAAGTEQVVAYRVGEDGGLTMAGEAGGLPETAQGLAVR
jgi:6-phosphogluconolactonase (cycloisomerase 2 family)